MLPLRPGPVSIRIPTKELAIDGEWLVCLQDEAALPSPSKQALLELRIGLQAPRGSGRAQKHPKPRCAPGQEVITTLRV